MSTSRASSPRCGEEESGVLLRYTGRFLKISVTDFCRQLTEYKSYIFSKSEDSSIRIPMIQWGSKYRCKKLHLKISFALACNENIQVINIRLISETQ